MARYSIIVPVYNVEPYLRECLDSILMQDSPSEYEAILVDDGSTDNSGKICGEYAAKYPRFHVIHQKNQGLSAARNTGLRIAQGEYVLFLDSDDRWLPNMLSSMDAVTGQEADMTLFFYQPFDESGKRKPARPVVLPQGESGSKYIKRLIQENAAPVYNVWSCMYLRSFLSKNSLSFLHGLAAAEDSEFNLRAYQAASSVIVVPNVLHEYRIRSGSLSQTPTAAKFCVEIDIAAAWYRAFPCELFADRYCDLGISISKYRNEAEKRELVMRYALNADILENVSRSARIRMLRGMYRAFGYYGGSKAYFLLLKIKHPFTKLNEAGG